MKKRGMALFLAVLMIMILAGCGDRIPEETTEPTIPAPVETEVLYEPETEVKKYEGVQLRLLSPLWETDPEAAVMLQAAEVFRKQTGAEVQILWAADPAAGTGGCDIFQTALRQLDEALLAQTLDLGAMAQAAGYEQHSFESLRRQVTDRCGYLAGIPQIPAAGGVYYVQNVFSEQNMETPPQTWEQFLQLCQDLKDGGFVPMALNSEDEPLAAYLHFGAAGLIKAEEDKSKFADDETFLEKSQQILDFVSGGNLLTASKPAGQNKLALSNAVMTVGTNALCAEVAASTGTDLKWGVFPWPGGGSFVDSDVLCVRKGSEQPQAAFDFIMLLCTGEFDQLRVDVSGGIPADPANESAIAGAAQLLQAEKHSDAQLPENLDAELLEKLWAGKYKTGEQFAKAWDKTR